MKWREERLEVHDARRIKNSRQNRRHNKSRYQSGIQQQQRQLTRWPLPLRLYWWSSQWWRLRRSRLSTMIRRMMMSFKRWSHRLVWGRIIFSLMILKVYKAQIIQSPTSMGELAGHVTEPRPRNSSREACQNKNKHRDRRSLRLTNNSNRRKKAKSSLLETCNLLIHPSLSSRCRRNY